MALASLSKRSPDCSPRNFDPRRPDLDGISGTIHLSHPARSNGRKISYGPSFLACRKRHVKIIELSLGRSQSR